MAVPDINDTDPDVDVASPVDIIKNPDCLADVPVLKDILPLFSVTDSPVKTDKDPDTPALVVPVFINRDPETPETTASPERITIDPVDTAAPLLLSSVTDPLVMAVAAPLRT